MTSLSAQRIHAVQPALGRHGRGDHDGGCIMQRKGAQGSDRNGGGGFVAAQRKLGKVAADQAGQRKAAPVASDSAPYPFRACQKSFSF